MTTLFFHGQNTVLGSSRGFNMAWHGPKLVPKMASIWSKMAKITPIYPTWRRTTSRQAKMASTWSPLRANMVPRWPPNGPRCPYDSPNMGQDSPRRPQYGPKIVPDSPNMAQDGCLVWAQHGHFGAIWGLFSHMRLEYDNIVFFRRKQSEFKGSMGVQHGPEWSQHGPQNGSNGPRWPRYP
jgi:hypothetical protein